MFVLLKLTDACNLACSYCCMGTDRVAQTMQSDDAQQVVETLINHFKAAKSDWPDVCFHGGEPTAVGST